MSVWPCFRTHINLIYLETSTNAIEPICLHATFHTMNYGMQTKNVVVTLLEVVEISSLNLEVAD
jgi:hypothetical protein